MSDEVNQFRKLKHDLANPLAAILAETQLLLLDADSLGDEVVTSLREIESLSRRMKDILQEQADAS